MSVSPFGKIKRGMGIGGWMTNYKRVRFLPEDRALEITIGDKEHFDRYITRWDIQNIRSFCMDHIRIPFDQCVIEEYDKPFSYREDMLKLLDRIIGWSLDEGLEVVLNLHHAVGCYCDFAGMSSLVEDEFLMERLVRLWEMLEDRYHHLNIVFEFLNEITTQDSHKSNDLYGRCIAAIRAKNPTRRIIIGPAGGNTLPHIDKMKVYDDPYIGYTFHFYDPGEITHQRSTVSAACYLYNREIPYPCNASYIREFHEYFGRKAEWPYQYETIDERFLRDRLQPAVEFKKKYPDKWLWSGEFGTIHHMRIQWRENYMRDIIRFCKEYDIPFCNWNYLSTPYDCNKFSLVTEDERRIVSPGMLKIIQGNV